MLGRWQRLALGNPNLPFDEIKTGRHLRDRMLDLQPRVHFQKVRRV